MAIQNLVILNLILHKNIAFSFKPKFIFELFALIKTKVKSTHLSNIKAVQYRENIIAIL